MRAYNPEIEFMYFFNETGHELPETYDWLSRCEAHLGKPIERIGKSLTDVMLGYGILPSIRRRYCTRETKIFPMEDRFRQIDGPVHIYFGLRYDEQERNGYNPGKTNIVPHYPLKHNKMAKPHVFATVDYFNLAAPTFFWERLYEDVGHEMGILKTDLAKLSRLHRKLLFAWRTRPNCFDCFYQSTWELVGLLEHHPELFAQAEAWEATLGGDEYSYLKDWPLPRIRREKAKIYQRRLNKVTRTVNRVLASIDLGVPIDEIPMMGECGILCGK